MKTIEKGRSRVELAMPDYNLPHIRNLTASKVIKKIVKKYDMKSTCY